jgi:hypothetical protein
VTPTEVVNPNGETFHPGCVRSVTSAVYFSDLGQDTNKTLRAENDERF